MGMEFLGVRTLGAEASARDWGIGIALDLDDVVSLGVDDLPATDAAVRTDGFCHLGADEAGAQILGFVAVGGLAGSEEVAFFELLNDGPTIEKIFQHAQLRGKVPNVNQNLQR